MAEFSFYGSARDRLLVLESILRLRSHVLVSNTNHSTPIPRTFAKVDDELLQALSVNKCFHIIGPFSTEPVKMREVKGGPRDGTFRVDELRGGPLLTLLLPTCKVENNVVRLDPGCLWRHRFYVEDRAGQPQPVAPTEDVKKGYAQIVAQLKPHLPKRKRWMGERIGNDGVEELEQGKAVILVNGKWYSRDGFVCDNR